MNNPFTVEETNLMCVFETSNRMKLMEEIRRVMLHIKDSDMEELAGQVLRKLDGMTDKEFLKISFVTLTASTMILLALFGLKKVNKKCPRIFKRHNIF